MKRSPSNDEQRIILAEYKALRKEVVVRAELLHLLIDRATWLTFAAIIVGLALQTGSRTSELELFIALAPLAFAGICFNFQANQLTMELAAEASNRLRKLLSTSGESWDDQFGRLKLGIVTTSLLKDFSLLAPIIALLIAGYELNLWVAYPYLFALNHLLAVIVTANFWYKRR